MRSVKRAKLSHTDPLGRRGIGAQSSETPKDEGKRIEEGRGLWCKLHIGKKPNTPHGIAEGGEKKVEPSMLLSRNEENGFGPNSMKNSDGSSRRKKERMHIRTHG